VTEDRLKLYAANSDGKFRWETVDLDSNPSRALRYGATTYGTIVLEAERAKGDVREEKVQDAEEETLTNALIRVTREGKRAVHFLKGHGEKDLASSERAGLSQLKAALEKVNYEAKDSSWPASQVPDDAAIVVVAGPDKDSTEQVDALTKYVGRAGGSCLVDPFRRRDGDLSSGTGSASATTSSRQRSRTDVRHGPGGADRGRLPVAPDHAGVPPDHRLRSPARSA
jgi:hypothetical protein